MEWLKEHLEAAVTAMTAVFGFVAAFLGLQHRVRSLSKHQTEVDRILRDHQRRLGGIETAHQMLAAGLNAHLEQGQHERQEILQAIRDLGDRFESKMDEAAARLDGELVRARDRIDDIANATAITQGKVTALERGR
jgi:chromosome segregation ATPase